MYSLIFRPSFVPDPGRPHAAETELSKAIRVGKKIAVVMSREDWFSGFEIRVINSNYEVHVHLKNDWEQPAILQRSYSVEGIMIRAVSVNDIKRLNQTSTDDFWGFI